MFYLNNPVIFIQGEILLNINVGIPAQLNYLCNFIILKHMNNFKLIGDHKSEKLYSPIKHPSIGKIKIINLLPVLNKSYNILAIKITQLKVIY